MGKALMGSHVSPSSLRLLDEVRVLRQRVAELERALAQAQSVRDDRALDDHPSGPDDPSNEARADVSDGREPAHR